MSDPSDNPLKRLIGEIHRRSLWQVPFCPPRLNKTSYGRAYWVTDSDSRVGGLQVLGGNAGSSLRTRLGQ